MSEKENTKIYTFYSYKGGSGRSTTTMNTLLHLIDEIGADSAHPILLVDADLESSGLTFFFNQENRFLGGKELTRYSAFDTSYIFSGTADPSHYFKESTALDEIPDELLEELSKNFRAVETLFEGVSLPNPMWGMLAYLVEKYNDYKDGDISNTKICNLFDLSKFISSIRHCNDLNATEEEKIKTKCRLIREFLPIGEYADISRYFGKPAGTVRFLGVDTRQNEEHVARGVAADALTKLCRACTRRNYKAIIFDSGAGTQSSAHLFQQTSDVIVCCMRPTRQFAQGTKLAIRLYKNSYKTTAHVILLPTAVPQNDSMGALRKGCFEEINKIVNEAASGVIDATFCTPETALCEVSLFKWREQILGVSYDYDNDDFGPLLADDIAQVVKPYGNPDTLPADAKKAYETYRKLAEKIAEYSNIRRSNHES